MQACTLGTPCPPGTRKSILMCLRDPPGGGVRYDTEIDFDVFKGPPWGGSLTTRKSILMCLRDTPWGGSLPTRKSILT